MAVKMTENSVGLFVGLTTLDFVYYADEYPDRNHKMKTQNYKRYLGGPAANAAITYSLLGGKAVLISCLGKSAEAELMKKLLKEYNITVIDCSDETELPTMATIIVDSNGGRTIFSGQRLFAQTDISGLESYAADSGSNIGFCLFDLNQQEISLDILKNINSLSSEIVIDAGNWKPNTEAFIKKASVVIASETFKSPEGRNIFEIPGAAKAQKAITRGERDILTENGSVPVENVEAVDTLAAGDIFHGAFCYGYYNKGLDFDGALKFAAGIASKSVKHYGPREWAKDCLR